MADKEPVQPLTIHNSFFLMAKIFYHEPTYKLTIGHHRDKTKPHSGANKINVTPAHMNL